MWPIATDVWRGVCVCVSEKLRYPVKTAGPIEMPFGVRARVGPQNHVLHGGPDPTRGKDNFGLGWGRAVPE